MLDNSVIAVVGPTASGKTGLAVKIAKEFAGEVVSADSMQIYKELFIGNARPTPDEMENVEHHLIGTVGIGEHYSVADFVNDADKEINDIFANNRVPVVCGGTGLYVDSLLSGTEFEEIKSNDAIRKKYYEYAEKNGNIKLHELLEKADPVSADKIHSNNIVRVVRALEVYEITGKRMSDLQAESHKMPYPHKVCYIGLSYLDRNILYNRINTRIDNMLNEGLLDEARFVYDSSNAETARQAIGYKEFFPFFEGEMSLGDAVEILKKESRHYAKRQLTWFMRNKNIKWFFADEYDNRDNMTEDVINYINKWSSDEK